MSIYYLDPLKFTDQFLNAVIKLIKESELAREKNNVKHLNVILDEIRNTRENKRNETNYGAIPNEFNNNIKTLIHEFGRIKITINRHNMFWIYTLFFNNSMIQGK